MQETCANPPHPVNPAETDQPDEWFVRVESKDYGPVDLDSLLEWKEEGRLIPQNYLRRSSESAWVIASSVEELYPKPEADSSDSSEVVRRRTLGEIFAETVRIYARGFPQFFVLALLVALPSLALKISLAYIHYPEGGIIPTTSRVASAVAVVMLGLVLVGWPIFVGGLQFAASDLAAGRSVQLRDLLQRAINLWPRIARLSLFVYGSYIFWTALPLLLILTLVTTPSLPSIFIALLALAFQVYMAGRLFVNFMFWQQTCTLDELDSVEALRESKELARSRVGVPPMQRPLYRGALIASLWLLVLIALSVAVELPFMVMRLQGITNFEDAYALLKNIANAPAPDAITITTYVLSTLVHAALRPLLGIAFVVLYLDAKAK